MCGWLVCMDVDWGDEVCKIYIELHDAFGCRKGNARYDTFFPESLDFCRWLPALEDVGDLKGEVNAGGTIPGSRKR